MLLVGCGRLGFDATGGGGGSQGDSGANEGGIVDGTVDAAFDAPAGSITVTFGEVQGTTFTNVTRDTYISNETGEAALNYGSDREMRIERDVQERALMAFDLTALPSTATVVFASIRVNVLQLPPAPLPIDLHRLLESWDEGTGFGTNGVSNYTTRSVGTSWSLAGASPPASASAAIGSFSPVGVGLLSFALPVATVQGWIMTPSTNNGILMIARSDDSTRLTASEGVPQGDRPVLTVTYVP